MYLGQRKSNALGCGKLVVYSVGQENNNQSPRSIVAEKPKKKNIHWSI